MATDIKNETYNKLFEAIHDYIEEATDGFDDCYDDYDIECYAKNVEYIFADAMAAFKKEH